jgi:hypothetical protein
MRTTLAVVAVGTLLLSGCGTTSPDSTRSRRTPAEARPVAQPAATVVAVGDIACPPGARRTARTCRQAATARVARALAPQRVVALGDLQYQKGSYPGFTHSYRKSWGTLKRITWPVPGNHEYLTPGARGYYRYFTHRQPGGPGYYRRELNGWQLYLLNSNCGKVDCATQRAWLEREMAAHPSTCSLIALHHPRFSSGEHASNAGMRRFWDVAYAHHADIALSGHDHDYERFAPMSPAGAVEPGRGIQQFVSGGGGRSLYPQTTTTPGSEVFLRRFGVLRLTLRPTGYSWEFRDLHNTVRDSGSAACR